MTDAERAIWFAVRDRRLAGFKFRRQVTIGPFIADFVCVAAMLVVEVDGGQHSEATDAARTAAIEAAGYKIIRYWNNDVLDNLPGVLEMLQSEVTKRLASPSPRDAE